MRKQTDLDEIKRTAINLLHTDIYETPYSPMIVKHPFADTGLTALPDGNGGITMINLMEEDAQNRWRQTMAQSINKANSAYEIYMMTNKPYSLTFLKYTSPYLSKADFSKILADAWIRSENPNCDTNVSKSKLISMFKQADPHELMLEDELRQYEELDDTVTVYRGVTSHNAKNIKALSWTLDREKAEWFAHRFNEDGTVYEAEIDKQHILALFNGRNESEVIVDPKFLMDIRISEEPVQGLNQTM